MSDELTGKSVKEVAAELGKSLPTVYNRMKILEIQTDKGNLYPTDIEKIANYKRGSSESAGPERQEQKAEEPTKSKTRKTRERKTPYREDRDIRIGTIYLGEGMLDKLTERVSCDLKEYVDRKLAATVQEIKDGISGIKVSVRVEKETKEEKPKRRRRRKAEKN